MVVAKFQFRYNNRHNRAHGPIRKKLFSKKTGPELERILKQILAGGKEPKDPQGLTKSAVKGAEMRHWLFKLLEEFETETGKIGGFEGDDGFFYHPQLIDWFQKRHGLPESMLFLGH